MIYILFLFISNCWLCEWLKKKPEVKNNKEVVLYSSNIKNITSNNKHFCNSIEYENEIFYDCNESFGDGIESEGEIFYDCEEELNYDELKEQLLEQSTDIIKKFKEEINKNKSIQNIWNFYIFSMLFIYLSNEFLEAKCFVRYDGENKKQFGNEEKFKNLQVILENFNNLPDFEYIFFFDNEKNETRIKVSFKTILSYKKNGVEIFKRLLKLIIGQLLFSIESDIDKYLSEIYNSLNYPFLINQTEKLRQYKIEECITCLLKEKRYQDAFVLSSLVVVFKNCYQGSNFKFKESFKIVISNFSKFIDENKGLKYIEDCYKMKKNDYKNTLYNEINYIKNVFVETESNDNYFVVLLNKTFNLQITEKIKHNILGCVATSFLNMEQKIMEKIKNSINNLKEKININELKDIFDKFKKQL